MKLYIIFGLRTEQYPGQNAPEALEVIDEYTLEDDCPDFLSMQMEHHGSTGEFSHLRVFTFDVSDEEIREKLTNPQEIIVRKIF